MISSKKIARLASCRLFTFFIDNSSSLIVYKQKTAYEVRISDWSSDVCSSDHDTFQKYQNNDVVVLGLATAFEDFDKNTLENLKLLLKENKVIGEIGRASCRERVCQYV